MTCCYTLQVVTRHSYKSTVTTLPLKLIVAESCIYASQQFHYVTSLQVSSCYNTFHEVNICNNVIQHKDSLPSNANKSYLPASDSISICQVCIL